MANQQSQVSDNSVAMMTSQPDAQGNYQPAKMVPADQVDVAKAAGWTNAVKMQSPKGELKWVPDFQVDQARKSNYAVAPQPGVQRMATPQGQITYALPSEVDQFKSSGHVPIDDNGNFRVDPIPGEDNVDTMKRAGTINRNLPPDVMKKAIDAEKSTITAKRVVGTLAAAPVIGAVGAGALAGAAELGGAGATALRAAGPPVANFARQVGTEIVKKYAGETAAKTTADLLVKGAGAVGLGWLVKLGLGSLKQ